MFEDTSYNNYIPVNSWEEIVKSKIFIEQIDDKKSKYPIENLYYQIYDTENSSDMIKKFNYINMHIYDILILYSEDPRNLIEFKNDIQLVFVFKTIAIKIFKLKSILFKKHDELFKLLLKNECPNLETIYRAYPITEYNIYVVISKVVDSSNFKKNISKNIIQYNDNIHNGIQYLYEHGWVHRDVSINNSGYDEKSNNYLLFDFNLSKKLNDIKELYEHKINDQKDLEKSIKFNFEIGICL